MTRVQRVFREWQHPRDARGRFARTGGGSWAKRAAGAFEAAGAAPEVKLRGPRVGRNAKAAALLNQHVPGSGDRLSRTYVPTPKIPDGATSMPLNKVYDAGTRKHLQVLHEGAWLEISGSGFRGGVDHILLRGKNGERIEITDTGQQLVTRPHRLEFHEPLISAQVKAMDQWKADAAKSPQFRAKTLREANIERIQDELNTAQGALKEANRKARARANRKYPNKEGYGKYTRDQYIDRETWSEQHAVTLAEHSLKYQHEDSGTPSDKYLNGPSGDTPVFTGTLDPARPLAVYGDLLNIQDEDQGTYRHLADLALMPAELHAIVAAHMHQGRTRWVNPELGKSAGIWLGSRPINELDHSQDLTNVHPRGWAEDKTWSHVDGVYRSGGTLVVGVSESSQRRGEHGQPALHEFGHALDDAAGDLLRAKDPAASRDASEDPAWVAVWRQTIDAAPDISPYFRQPEPAGSQEMWAEAFGEWARARAKARRSSFYTEATDGGRTYLASRGEMAMRVAFRIPQERHDAAAALNSYFEGLVAKLGVDL